MSHTVLLAEIPHGIDLIFHQCYEGRHNDGSALHQQSGQLVTQRFAPTRGHKDKGIMFIHEILHDLLLVAFEGVEAKVFFKLAC